MAGTKKHPSIHLLVDYALGRLSPEESLEVTEIVQEDSELSETLEVIIELVNLAASDPVVFQSRQQLTYMAGRKRRTPSGTENLS
jgi:hypothetical protein